MNGNVPYTVRFREVTDYTVTVTALDEAEAIARATQMTTTLSPAERARAFTLIETRYEAFAAKPDTKRFRVRALTRALYQTDVEAIDAENAEEIADEMWNIGGPEEFEFLDIEDVDFDAEELCS